MKKLYLLAAGIVLLTASSVYAAFPYSMTFTPSTGNTILADHINTSNNEHINNNIPESIDDYSVNVAEMQTVSDPGEVGTESLATTIAGNIERVRNIIKEITGEAQWYVTPARTLISISNKNIAINGNFDIWQRGTSVAVVANTKTYTADRWAAYAADNALTIARQTGENDGSLYASRVQRDSSETGTAAILFESAFETDDIAKIRGQKLTLSFFAKKGANFSPTSDNLVIKILSGTGAEATSLNVGFTGTVADTLTQAITSSSVKYTLTTAVVVASNSTQMAIQFSYTPTGTAGADDWFQIEQVQLEKGITASDYEIKDIKGELSNVRRYTRVSSFFVPATTAQNLGLIDMRVVPTITGGGSGFNSTGTTVDSLIAFQTSGAVAVLTLDSEL